MNYPRSMPRLWILKATKFACVPALLCRPFKLLTLQEWRLEQPIVDREVRLKMKVEKGTLYG